MAIEEELTVVIMGATGTGKSTFVNLASGSQFPVGSGLKSCTPAVQVSEPFVLGGRRMRLIDTPGFDDTTRTDSDILRIIVTYLADEYRHNKKVSGIVYMHRISDFKMTGVSRRNFGMLRKICGEQTLKNIVIVTNMWGLVSEESGAARERELATDDLLFKPLLDKGATMMRHYNTQASVHDILLKCLGYPPGILQVQDEVVNCGKTVDKTQAGLHLVEEENRAIREAQRRQEEELQKLQEEREAAARAQELRRIQEVEHAKREMEARVALEHEAYQREIARQDVVRRQEEVRRQELQRAWEAEQAANRASEEEARRIQEAVVQQAREAEAAQARLRAEVNRLQNRRRRGNDCIIC